MVPHPAKHPYWQTQSAQQGEDGPLSAQSVSPADDGQGVATAATLSLLHPDLTPLGPIFGALLDGLVVVEADSRCLYANLAACEIIGHPLEDLIGHDVSSYFPTSDRDTIRDRLASAAADHVCRGTSRLSRPDGQEREIEYTVTAFSVRGQSLATLMFRDVSEIRRLVRKADALTQIASSVAFASSLEATLDALARSVVQATGTAACGVVLIDEEQQKVRVFGTYGIPKDQIDWEAMRRAGAEPPGLDAVRLQKTVVHRGLCKKLLTDPVYAPVHHLLSEAPWDAVVSVPLRCRDRIVGALSVFYPHRRDPGESEIAFLSAIADQAAVAAENARLYLEARDKAALEERQRLARELHDSVSQALYGIALGARTARTLLDRDPDHAAEPLDYVLSLAEAGLAEMRALIFELRPESLETEGLIAALDKHLAVIRTRHGLAVRATLPDEPDLPLDVKQAVYRIAQEALNNTVKHARARQVDLRLERSADEVILEVSDDGVGFDSEASFPGHLGLRSMRERAAGFGGRIEVESVPARGTRIDVHIPYRGTGFREDVAGK